MMGGRRDDAEGHAREDVGVVPLPGKVLLAVVLDRGER